MQGKNVSIYINIAVIAYSGGKIDKFLIYHILNGTYLKKQTYQLKILKGKIRGGEMKSQESWERLD